MTERQLDSIHDDLGDSITRIEDGNPVLLCHNGGPVGALVSVADLRLLEEYWQELENRIDLEEIRKVKEEIMHEGTESWDSVKKVLRQGTD